MNIFILDKNYNQIGMLSNEGANPQAPYFDDLYTQELDTGADTFYFTTLSTRASRGFIEIGNHIIFQFNNRHRLFAISDLEFEHKEGRNVIGVYAEGVGFQLLETFMGEFEGGDDTDGDGEVDNNSGEFLTYDMFLEKVLKDTDWNYQIMSGDLTNINMGKEVTFQNGKNIYALLQDSMQEFGGIELEFRAEYVGGSLNKTIYAYPHKGRGSFVGQRFEYGHNVAGIKKKQEIIDGLDENIILYEGLETVDGLNVEVTYEVDFALRGYEVEELEIGDTHYVIDNDFEPAQIEARIGKIEISFSDPTRNKCYIANFKKISGSKPDNIDSDNVEDIIEDNLDDKLDELIDDKLGELIGDDFKNHTHDRLVSENDGSKTPLVFKSGHGFTADNNKWHMAHLVTSDIGLNFGATDAPDHWTSVYIERSSSLANGAKKTATIFTSDGNMVPDANNQYIGASNRRWKAIYSNYIDAANSVSSPRYFGYNYQVRFDRDDMQNVTKVTDKQDLLDFIVNKVNVYKYSAKEVDDAVGAPDKISYQEYYGLLAEDFTTHSSSTDCGGSEVAYNIMKNLLTDDTNNDGEINGNDGHNKHTYNLPALVTTLIGAFQQHVENGDDGSGGEEIDLSAYATKTYVDDEIDKTKKYVDDAIDNIEFPSGDDGEGNVAAHTHDRLTSNDKTLCFTYQPDVTGGYYYGTPSLSTEDFSISLTMDKKPSSSYINWIDFKVREETTGKTASIFTNTNDLIPISTDSQSIGEDLKRWKYGYINNIESNNINVKENIKTGTINADLSVTAPTLSANTLVADNINVDTIRRAKWIKAGHSRITDACSSTYFLPCSETSMDYNMQRISETSKISKQKILNLILDLNVYSCVPHEFKTQHVDEGLNPGQFLYVLDKEVVNHISSNNCNYQEAAQLIFRDVVYDSNGNGYFEPGEIDTHDTHWCSLPSLVSALVVAFQQLANNYSDDSLKENIRHLDSETTPDIGEGEEPNFLVKADLHDFIVNQVHICEFNYIDDYSDKIGFIANEHEGTKVGDKIVSRQGEDNLLTYDLNNLVFATIGALQEEVRIKDEKIASLEARLARIEEMLNNN